MSPIILLLAATSLALHGCKSPMRLYKEKIEIISHQQQPTGVLEIVFKTPIESMHYCAGANLQEEAGITRVSLIRCGINEKCVTDSPALDVSDGKSKIEIKSNSGHLIFVFEDGEKMVQAPAKSKP